MYRVQSSMVYFLVLLGLCLCHGPTIWWSPTARSDQLPCCVSNPKCLTWQAIPTTTTTIFIMSTYLCVCCSPGIQGAVMEISHGPPDLHVQCSIGSFKPLTVLLLYDDLVTFTTLVNILYIIYIYMYAIIYIYMIQIYIYTVICYSAHWKIHVWNVQII